MKTRRLIIGIVVLIVAGAAAFAGVSMTESKVENSVREALGSVLRRGELSSVEQ